MLPFGDPSKLKTKKVVFEDIFIAHDSGTLEQLKELSSRRKAIEESINESSFITEAVAREMAGGLTSHYEQELQKLQRYLPLLENLVFHVESVNNNQQMVQWTQDLKIRWSSVLCASSIFNLMGPKFFQIDNLRFELGMVLFLYGAILRERASEILTADLVQSATLYRKAAGVYDHLANKVLPSLQPALAQERIPEATLSICSIMSLICLAEAQAVTIRKAEEKGTARSLLAKLHHGISQSLDEAASILYSTTGDCKDISVRFLDFISSCRALHTLRSQKYLAEDLKTAGQVGVAIGVLRRALENSKEKMPREKSWHLVFRQEMDVVSEMLRRLEHENDFVWHEKVHSGDELPSVQGMRIVSPIPYCSQRWERELVFKI
ncbi:PREDICTED: BRO1 domain-containing protein BROX [Nelumbo nucifera]|uniref:BRO1 domain-containing protein BROX n=1 Tax=Nelumbo nucifera TaxID=4432 RepID=A0A1U8A8V8_NELNU|nr:PREDICTED: BRO1 domain-containing protein BROX [Nelumbo nucifera]XP_019054176.1 PREDICTED: BRO1 domain-containing protein BROX [Nelumbo nucifera]